MQSRAAAADDDDNDCNKKSCLFLKGTFFSSVLLVDIPLDFDDEVENSRRRRRSLGWKVPFSSLLCLETFLTSTGLRQRSREQPLPPTTTTAIKRVACFGRALFFFRFVCKLSTRLRRRSREQLPPPQVPGLEGSLFFFLFVWRYWTALWRRSWVQPPPTTTTTARAVSAAKVSWFGMGFFPFFLWIYSIISELRRRNREQPLPPTTTTAIKRVCFVRDLFFLEL